VLPSLPAPPPHPHNKIPDKITAASIVLPTFILNLSDSLPSRRNHQSTSEFGESNASREQTSPLLSLSKPSGDSFRRAALRQIHKGQGRDRRKKRTVGSATCRKAVAPRPFEEATQTSLIAVIPMLHKRD
jgi:hypothetical protein